MDGRTVDLKYPIKVSTGQGQVEVSRLTLGRIKVKHLKKLPASLFEQALAQDGKEKLLKINPIDAIPLIASLANISDEEAGEIDLEDLAGVAETLGEGLEDFLAESPQTGKK